MANEDAVKSFNGHEIAQKHLDNAEKSTEAILKDSAPVPDGVPQVSGVEFDNFNDHDITVLDLLSSMENMGFQASQYPFAVLFPSMLRFAEFNGVCQHNKILLQTVLLLYSSAMQPISPRESMLIRD